MSDKLELEVPIAAVSELLDEHKQLLDLAMWIADGMPGVKAPHRVSEARKRARDLLQKISH